MKTLIILTLALFSLVACQKIVETDDSLILVPSQKSGPTVAILGLNGAFCDPHVYIGIFQTIQNYSNYTIWAALPKFPYNFPMFVSSHIATTLSDLQKQGADTTNLFVVGHSLGGIIGQGYIADNSTGIMGLVLLGKFLSFDYQDPQVNYPVPVLTISGELDGLTKISRIAMSFNQMLRHPQQKGHLRFPVTIIPGAYHSSFITGDIPTQINASDIKPEISNQQAWYVTAQLIDAFVDAQLHLNSSDTNPGAKFLSDYVYGKTYPLMKPLLDAFALEGNPYLYNASLVGYTKWVVDNIFDEMNISSATIPTNISSQEHDRYQFIFDTPSASVQNGTLNHQTYTYKYIGTVESDDMSNIPYQSAYWISVKYKSAEFIYKTANISATPTQMSCKTLNQKAIDQVLATIPAKNLERYQKYGVKLVAGEDTVYSNSISWQFSSIDYQDNGGVMSVSSPRLHTKLDAWFSSGNFYCKLLSPARVAEWIYVDSLRKFDGAGVVNSTLST